MTCGIYDAFLFTEKDFLKQLLSLKIKHYSIDNTLLTKALHTNNGSDLY